MDVLGNLIQEKGFDTAMGTAILIEDMDVLKPWLNLAQVIFYNRKCFKFVNKNTCPNFTLKQIDIYMQRILKEKEKEAQCTSKK